MGAEEGCGWESRRSAEKAAGSWSGAGGPRESPAGGAGGVGSGRVVSLSSPGFFFLPFILANYACTSFSRIRFNTSKWVRVLLNS